MAFVGWFIGVMAVFFILLVIHGMSTKKHRIVGLYFVVYNVLAACAYASGLPEITQMCMAVLAVSVALHYALPYIMPYFVAKKKV